MTLCCFLVYSTRRFVVCLSTCHFVLVFFSPFSIAITSLGEERANLSAFPTFVRFVLVWICQFPLPLGVWEGLRFVIVALPGLFPYLFLQLICRLKINLQIPYIIINCSLFGVPCAQCTEISSDKGYNKNKNIFCLPFLPFFAHSSALKSRLQSVAATTSAF